MTKYAPILVRTKPVSPQMVKEFTQGLSLFQKAERKSYKNQRNVYYK